MEISAFDWSFALCHLQENNLCPSQHITYPPVTMMIENRKQVIPFDDPCRNIGTVVDLKTKEVVQKFMLPWVRIVTLGPRANSVPWTYCFCPWCFVGCRYKLLNQNCVQESPVCVICIWETMLEHSLCQSYCRRKYWT